MTKPPSAKQLSQRQDTNPVFQLYFGSNSEASYPVHFYLDNIVIYRQGPFVPETTSTLALLALAAIVSGLLRSYLPVSIWSP
jgi:hypothetical protein